LSVHELGDATVGPLLKAVAHPRPRRRRFAAWALGQTGPAAKEAVPALRRALADPDGRVRLLAAWALWKVESRPADVVPAVIAGLREGTAAAALVLRGIGEPALPEMLRFFATVDDETAGQLALTAGAIAGQSEAALKALRAGLSGPAAAVPWVRRALDRHAELAKQSGEAARLRRSIPPAWQQPPDPAAARADDLEHAGRVMLR
jgi:HEAT repeat protein